MIDVDDRQRGLAVVIGFAEALKLVVEHIGQAFQEQQRQQVIVELGRVFFAADPAGGVPQHLFHALVAEHGAAGHATPAAGLGFRLGRR